MVGMAAIHRFNPSLVRLARSAAAAAAARRQKFQSQLGSIGAIAIERLAYNTCNVSIPAWFDWRAAVLQHRAAGRAGFNPSLVRLAPGLALPLRPVEPWFQSQLGSIGAQELHRPAVGGGLFQSQLGSIGALLPSAQRPGLSPFQSQLGSIGAATDWTTGPVLLPRFNPSLVRLAPGWPTLASCARRSFNPSLVRLARRCPPGSELSDCRFNPSLVRLAPHSLVPAGRAHRPFQSQLGSIGAYITTVGRRCSEPCFNPSLVRLARPVDALKHACQLRFNPSLVRLAP